MDLILVPISISFFICSLITYKLYQWRLRYNLPPGPYPLPFIGNLHTIEPDRADCFQKWSTTYGPIISVWFGSTLNVIVSSSQLAKEVLKDKDDKLANRHRNKLTDMITQNGKDLSWADYTPSYVNLRKICALELFTSSRIEAIRSIREDEVKTMIQSIFTASNKHHLVVRNYVGLATFNIITRMVLGKKFSSKGMEFKEIAAEELKLGAIMNLLEYIPGLIWLRKKAFSDHKSRRDGLIQAIIDEHKTGKSKHGFVDALLNEIDEETMRGLIWDLITAGIDTTAITVEWGMAEIMRNPRVQCKIQEELDSVIGLNRTMSESDISKLSYLECFVKEVLRLHPPTPLMLPHKASEDVKVGGYDIPKGTIVCVNVRAIGTDPNNWEDPSEFRPERFLEEDVDLKGSDFRVLPFGAGRRMCPAAQLSVNLVASMIGHLCHHFRWRPPFGVLPEEIDMSGTPALVNYIRTPLLGVPKVRLQAHLYNHISNSTSSFIY
ncbi:cytochrome P450 98A2-like [Euphorbia lathyris]|uniref:cytochrome P450 98A2-like n=1 Tax=Euphorbia lathyris TaxID=212925 RepID=UPI003314320A